MTEPLISVVMPVRNEERFIDQSLRSLRRQTLQAIEVLVIDDGSTDSTTERLARHTREDARVRVLDNPGDGLIDALHHGVEKSRSKLIARMDGDDIAAPGRLQRQLEELQRNPNAACLGTYGWRINERGVRIGRLINGPSSPQEFAQARAAKRPVHLTHPSVVFRRDAFDAVGGYDPAYHRAEDLRLFNDLAEQGEVYALPEALIRVRIRMTGASAASLELQALQATRVGYEVAGGTRYASPEAFVRELEQCDPESLAEHHSGWKRNAAQRTLARAVANGQVMLIARLIADGGVGAGMVHRIARRALRG